MKTSALGQVYGKRFDCPPLRTDHVLPNLGFKISSSIGANLARDLGRQFVKSAGIGAQLQQIIGAGKPRLRFPTAAFSKILDMPVFADYRGARRRACRRHGLIAHLELPGEAGIGDLTAALNALAAGDHARLTRLHRRLRAQARRGDTQSEALAAWVDVVLELLRSEEIQRRLLAIRAQVRVDELAALARVRTAARAQRRRRPPRHEHNPVRGRRCPHAPPATSAVPYPEVAA